MGLPAAAAAYHTRRLVDRFFREESGRAVAVLCRTFGASQLQLAEDSVQEAIVRAIRLWPFQGIPAHPSAWLITTARNVAYDELRRRQNLQSKEASICQAQALWADSDESRPDEKNVTDVDDLVLRLIFVCCDPAVPANAQPVLALKTVCGFSTREIADAFFLSEANIHQRLSRARKALADAEVEFELPTGKALDDHLAGVARTIYQLFTEGCFSKSNETPIRPELCDEALRLVDLLASLPVGDVPWIHALYALMLFHASRIPARLSSPEGEPPTLLQHQDRSLWDQAMIADAFRHLALSASGSQLHPYHLQASIAAAHTSAKSFEASDWGLIESLYQTLYELDPSPIVALNRSVAISFHRGPEAALAELNRIGGFKEMQSTAAYHMFAADLFGQMGQATEASRALNEALRVTKSKAERSLISDRAHRLSFHP